MKARYRCCQRGEGPCEVQLESESAELHQAAGFAIRPADRASDLPCACGEPASVQVDFCAGADALLRMCASHYEQNRETWEPRLAELRHHHPTGEWLEVEKPRRKKRRPVRK